MDNKLEYLKEWLKGLHRGLNDYNPPEQDMQEFTEISGQLKMIEMVLEKIKILE